MPIKENPELCAMSTTIVDQVDQSLTQHRRPFSLSGGLQSVSCILLW